MNKIISTVVLNIVLNPFQGLFRVSPAETSTIPGDVFMAEFGIYVDPAETNTVPGTTTLVTSGFVVNGAETNTTEGNVGMMSTGFNVEPAGTSTIPGEAELIPSLVFLVAPDQTNTIAGELVLAPSGFNVAPDQTSTIGGEVAYILTGFAVGPDVTTTTPGPVELVNNGFVVSHGNTTTVPGTASIGVSGFTVSGDQTTTIDGAAILYRSGFVVAPDLTTTDYDPVEVEISGFVVQGASTTSSPGAAAVISHGFAVGAGASVSIEGPTSMLVSGFNVDPQTTTTTEGPVDITVFSLNLRVISNSGGIVTVGATSSEDGDLYFALTETEDLSKGQIENEELNEGPTISGVSLSQNDDAFTEDLGSYNDADGDAVHGSGPIVTLYKNSSASTVGQSVVARPFTITNANGHNQYFRLEVLPLAGAGKRSGTPGYSSWVQVAAPIPGSPEISVAASGSTSIDVTLVTPGADADLYVVERSLSGVGSWTEISSSWDGSSPLPDTGLTAETVYDYRAKSTNSFGQSGYSSIETVSTDSGSLPQARILINFCGESNEVSNPDANGRYWNNLSSNPTNKNASTALSWNNLVLVDENGDDSGLRFTWNTPADNDYLGGDGTNGGGTDTVVGIYPAAAVRSNVFAHPDGGDGLFTISGMNASYTYDSKAFGNRAGVTNRKLEMKKLGDSWPQQEIETANNTTLFCNFTTTGVTSQGFNWRCKAGSGFAHLSVFEIEQNA